MNWYEDHLLKATYAHSNNVVSTLDALYPPFKEKIMKLLKTIDNAKLPMMVFETYRSPERQLALYKKGKSKLKKNGMHQFGVAVDIVFLTPKGMLTWEGPWEQFGNLVRAQGLWWGGDFKTFHDAPHVQYIEATREAQNKIIKGDYPQ